jgi:hypothetical protein
MSLLDSNLREGDKFDLVRPVTVTRMSGTHVSVRGAGGYHSELSLENPELLAVNIQRVPKPEEILRSAFISSLRSGNWTQISGSLFGRMPCEVCALGVAARVLNGFGIGLDLPVVHGSGDTPWWKLIERHMRINGHDMGILYRLNDDMHFDLSRIADELEAKFSTGLWSERVTAHLEYANGL